MNKSLTHPQFLQVWYNRIGCKNKSIERHMEDIYEGLIDTIREEVRLNGQLRIKGIGKFYMIEAGGYEISGNGIFEEGTKHYVEKHYLPKFKVSQNFKDYVNDAIVSKEGRRKKKNGTLTTTDEELLAREEEKKVNDIRRILERKKKTGESINDINKDTRMKINRVTKE